MSSLAFHVLFAAALSLASAEEYLYTKPSTNIVLKGVGIGRNADYRAVRGEDAAFLRESFLERGVATGFINDLDPARIAQGSSSNLVTAGTGTLISDMYAPTFLDRFFSLLWPIASIVPYESELPKGKVTYYPATTNADFVISATNILPLAAYAKVEDFAFTTNGFPSNIWLSGTLKLATITNLYRIIRKDEAVLGANVLRNQRKFNCKYEYKMGSYDEYYPDDFTYAEGAYEDNGDKITYDYITGYTLTSYKYPAFVYTNNYSTAFPYISVTKCTSKRALLSSTRSLQSGKLTYYPFHVGTYESIDEGTISETPVDTNQVDGISFSHETLSTNAVPDIELVKKVQAFVIYVLQATEGNSFYGSQISNTTEVVENIVAAAPAEATYEKTENGYHWYLADARPTATLKAIFTKYSHISDFAAPAPVFSTKPTTDPPASSSDSSRYVTRRLAITDIYIYPLVKRSWRTYCKGE